MMKLLSAFAICALIGVSLALPVIIQNSLNDVEEYAPGYDAPSGEQLVRNPRQFSSVNVDVLSGKTFLNNFFLCGFY